MFVEEHGTGDGAIVLLHGFGATGAVWRRTVGELGDLWSGRIIVCDLPGHGGSPALPAYPYSAVAEAVAGVLPHGEVMVVVGHSYGGVIASLLASAQYGVQPASVVAAGVKVTWSDEELAGFEALATRSARWYDTREEAEDRYRRASGLTADVTDDPADLARGIVEVERRFRLSYDPAAALGGPDMAPALAAARCAVLLCRGADDPMVSAAELASFGVPSVDIPGAGHNVHVERPRAFAQVVVDFAIAHVFS